MTKHILRVLDQLAKLKEQEQDFESSPCYHLLEACVKLVESKGDPVMQLEVRHHIFQCHDPVLIRTAYSILEAFTPTPLVPKWKRAATRKLWLESYQAAACEQLTLALVEFYNSDGGARERKIVEELAELCDNQALVSTARVMLRIFPGRHS